MPRPDRNELWSRALLDELARAGVRELVVAPGSRSTPLVLAGASDARFRVTVQVDERSAAFLALGVGKATGAPAAVITTSGTAVANLFPAVVEAAQGETPLLLLTADRPPRLRGADANQAIDQNHIFGRYPRFFHELSPAEISEATLRHLRSVASRAVAAAVGDPAGPVHLNLPFDKPLEPGRDPGQAPAASPGPESGLAVSGRPGAAPFTRIAPRHRSPDPEGVAVLAERLERAVRPLLVAGPVPRPWELGAPVRRLAALGYPLLADPLSGARFGVSGGEAEGRVAAGADLFLRVPRVRRELRPDLVLRFGSSPTSAAVNAFLEELSGVPQVVVDGGDRWKDHLAVASHFLPWDAGRTAEELRRRVALGRSGAGSELLAPEANGPVAWAARWEEVEGRTRMILDGPSGHAAGFFEGSILRGVAENVPRDRILFISSSMPIRDLDTFAGTRRDGPLVLGNRGASGIDGIVSAAVGASLGGRKPVVAVLGDLALIHDMNGLLAARAPGVRVLFVVIQNDGGGIFHFLPVKEWEPPFTRLFATPHGRDVERIAALHDLPHLRVEGRSALEGKGNEEEVEPAEAFLHALEEALAWDESGILEVRTGREENERRHREVEAALRAALESDPEVGPSSGSP